MTNQPQQYVARAERFSRAADGTLNYEFTVNDPSALIAVCATDRR